MKRCIEHRHLRIGPEYTIHGVDGRQLEAIVRGAICPVRHRADLEVSTVLR